jgi:hypothetical protein
MTDLIARLYVAGKLVREDTLAENYEALAGQHLEVAAEAEARGQKWMVEVVNPDVPESERYFRFGSDSDGMVAPLAVDGL